jgi:hypothetical protein
MSIYTDPDTDPFSTQTKKTEKITDKYLNTKTNEAPTRSRLGRDSDGYYQLRYDDGFTGARLQFLHAEHVNDGNAQSFSDRLAQSKRHPKHAPQTVANSHSIAQPYTHSVSHPNPHAHQVAQSVSNSQPHTDEN